MYISSIEQFINTFTYTSKYEQTLRHPISNSKYSHLNTERLDIITYIGNTNEYKINFQELVYSLVDNSHFTKLSVFYNDASIDRRRWSDLQSSTTANKDILFRISISLKLSDKDIIDKLFASKQHYINPRVLRDKILSYFLFDVDGRRTLELSAFERNEFINNVLMSYQLKPLYCYDKELDNYSL